MNSVIELLKSVTERLIELIYESDKKSDIEMYNKMYLFVKKQCMTTCTSVFTLIDTDTIEYECTKTDEYILNEIQRKMN